MVHKQRDGRLGPKFKLSDSSLVDREEELAWLKSRKACTGSRPSFLPTLEEIELEKALIKAENQSRNSDENALKYHNRSLCQVYTLHLNDTGDS